MISCVAYAALAPFAYGLRARDAHGTVRSITSAENVTAVLFLLEGLPGVTSCIIPAVNHYRCVRVCDSVL